MQVQAAPSLLNTPRSPRKAFGSVLKFHVVCAAVSTLMCSLTSNWTSVVRVVVQAARNRDRDIVQATTFQLFAAWPTILDQKKPNKFASEI